MLENGAKPAARDGFQESQNRLAGVLRRSNLGGCQAAGEVRLSGRMPGAQGASLFRFRPAHRTADG